MAALALGDWGPQSRSPYVRTCIEFTKAKPTVGSMSSGGVGLAVGCMKMFTCQYAMTVFLLLIHYYINILLEYDERFYVWNDMEIEWHQIYAT